MNIALTVKKLIKYASYHLYLQEDDEIYYTNLLLRYFGLAEPSTEEIDELAIAQMEEPDALIEEMNEFFIKEKGYDENKAERETTYVMGILSPNPSEVNMVFEALLEDDPKAATDYLYELSIMNNYVAKTKVAKNIVWDAAYKDGSPLEISINLSKPEKNNKDIIKLVAEKANTNYPKCRLCKENVGYEGNSKWPARENIRIIPMNLDGDVWYLQYSPYGYYDEHCIVFHEKHIPMAMNEHIIRSLADFVDILPQYFIGSNSDLPIVGGSILNHEHFQGGLHRLPILLAKDKEVIKDEDGLKITTLDFYVTAIRFASTDREKVIKKAAETIIKWRSYDDPKHLIVSKDEEGQHSTCTPFFQKNGDVYECTIILRNNKCNEEHPDGIYHAHKEFHHIKQEGIGLIEAGGRFVLPARLVRQCKEVEDAVEHNMSEEEYTAKYPDLPAFKRMIDTMKETKVTSTEYINEVCRGILKNVAVYKDDEDGQAAFHIFLKEAI